MVHLVVSLFNGADVTARCKRKIPPFCALEQYVINEPELLQFHYVAGCDWKVNGVSSTLAACWHDLCYSLPWQLIWYFLKYWYAFRRVPYCLRKCSRFTEVCCNALDLLAASQFRNSRERVGHKNRLVSC